MRTILLGFLATLTLTLAGCVRDLPKSPLGDDALALFRGFDDDPDALVATLESMDATLAKLDLEAKRKKRTFDVPELSEADFGGADVPTKVDTKDQMRASLAGLSSHSVLENLEVQVEENMTCANAKAVKCHERTPEEGSDPALFLDGTDAVFRTQNTIRIQTIALDFWLQAPVDFRRVELSDGRQAAVARTWMTKSYDNDNGKRAWDQRFGLDVYIEDPKNPDQTRRYYATWLGPYVNGIAGQFLRPALRKGLEEGFTRPDDFIDDGGSCDVDLKECLADSPF